MSISLEEAKLIGQRLEVLVLKLNGSIKADGSTNTVGLIEQLDSILTRLDPNAVEFIAAPARLEMVKQHQKIEEMLVNQDQYFTDRIVTFEHILKSGANDLQKLSDTVQERTKEALNRDVGLVANGLQLRINEKTSDVMDKFDEFLLGLDNFKNNTGNNNAWIMLAVVFGVFIGVGIGVWLR